MNAVTRAAEEPRPVLWASWRRTLKLVNVFVADGSGGGTSWVGAVCEGWE